MNSVEWRDIDGFEGLYQVNREGEVKSLQGWNGHSYIRRERLIKPTMTTTGYKKVDLMKDGKKKTLKLHRVIANAFIPNPNKYPVINHIDGNPLNNTIENLEWCTQRANCQHAYDTGLHKKKLNELSIIDAYCNDDRLSASRVASAYNTTTSSVCKILKKHDVAIISNPSRYGIDIETIKREFDEGYTNAELANKYGCGRNLIARRRYQYKKGLI